MACTLLKTCTNAVTAEELLNLLLKAALDTKPVIITSEADAPQSCSAIDCDDIFWDLQTIAGMTASTDGFKVFTRAGAVTSRFTDCDNPPTLEQLIRELIAFDGTCYGINISTSQEVTALSCDNLPTLLERILMSFAVVDGCTVLRVTQITATDENYIKCEPFSGTLQSLSNALVPVNGDATAWAWRVSAVGGGQVEPEVLGILIAKLPTTDGNDFFSYTITDLVVNGDPAIDMNDIAFDAGCTNAIQAELVNTYGYAPAIVRYIAEDTNGPFSQDEIGLSISHIASTVTVTLNLIRTGLFDPTPVPVAFTLIMHTARSGWTATFTTADPTNAFIGQPAIIEDIFYIAGVEQSDATDSGKWTAMLEACGDFDFIVDVVKDSPTQTTVTVTNSLLEIGSFWVSDAANIPVQQLINTVDI